MAPNDGNPGKNLLGKLEVADVSQSPHIWLVGKIFKQLDESDCETYDFTVETVGELLAREKRGLICPDSRQFVFAPSLVVKSTRYWTYSTT